MVWLRECHPLLCGGHFSISLLLPIAHPIFQPVIEKVFPAEYKHTVLSLSDSILRGETWNCRRKQDVHRLRQKGHSPEDNLLRVPLVILVLLY